MNYFLRINSQERYYWVKGIKVFIAFGQVAKLLSERILLHQFIIPQVPLLIIMHVFSLTYYTMLSTTGLSLSIQAVDHVDYSYSISLLPKIIMSSFVAFIA